MNPPAYTLNGIRYQYPGSKFELSLDHLSIPSGSMVALVGPNGAGKSTLLQLLALLQKPTAGTIEFLGEDGWNGNGAVFQKRRQVVLVSHHPYLFSGTVYDNLCFGLRVRSVPQEEWPERAKEMLSLVELDGFEKKRAASLSAGQAQRLALARGMIVRPQALLLDEPTANIDAAMISRVEAVIAEVNHTLGMTVVFATHNFSQAFKLADSVVYLAEGRQVEYSHENIFSGRAQSDGQLSWIEPRPGSKIFFSGKHDGHVTCLISPDRIEISPLAGAIPAGSNRFSGTVTRLELSGQDLALARVSGDLNFRVNLSVQALEKSSISLSSRVLLQFPPEAVALMRQPKTGATG